MHFFFLWNGGGGGGGGRTEAGRGIIGSVNTSLKGGNPQCDATENLVEINPRFSDVME